MLAKARKRNMVLLPVYRVQAMLNMPIINILRTSLSSKNVNVKASFLSSWTVGECLLILLAIKLNSFGFCVGYAIGKSTVSLIKEANVIPISVPQFWTISLAVGFDIIWNQLLD